MDDINIFNELISAFGHIYVLTMSNRQDRRDMMNAQFDAMGIPRPDTHPAIRWFYGTPFPHNGLIADAFNRSGKGRFTKPNEYDCSRNHYSIVRICYDLGFERCLVIEDDVLFPRDMSLLASFIRSVPEDFDVIQGGGFTTDKRILPFLGKDKDKWFRHKHVGLWNASFYGLSRRGMEFYMAFMDKIKFWVADGPLYKAPLSENLINTYASSVPLAVQADKTLVVSDIRDGKNDSIDYSSENEYERFVVLNDYFSPDMKT